MKIEQAFTNSLCLSVDTVEEVEGWVAPDPRFPLEIYDPFDRPDLLDAFLNITDVESYHLFVISWGPLAGPVFLKIAAIWAYFRIEKKKAKTPLELIEAGCDAEFELAKTAVEMGYSERLVVVKKKESEAIVITDLLPLENYLPVETKWSFYDEKTGHYNFMKPSEKLPLPSGGEDIPVWLHFENAEEAVNLAAKAREALRKGNINLFWSWFHDNTRWSIENGWLKAEALNLLSPIAYHAIYASTKGLFTLRICSLCSRYFVPAKKTQKYCSYSCQTRAKTKRYRERLKGEE